MRSLHIDNRTAVAAVSALLLVILFVLPGFALAGPLTGTYKITSVVENGAAVQFSTEVNLVNPGDMSVTVTSVGVHSLGAPGHVLYVRTNVVIGPHASASTTVSFVIPKRDFELWSATPQQMFMVRRVPAGETPTVENVALMRTKE